MGLVFNEHTFYFCNYYKTYEIDGVESLVAIERFTSLAENSKSRPIDTRVS